MFKQIFEILMKINSSSIKINTRGLQVSYIVFLYDIKLKDLYVLNKKKK